MKSVRQLGEDNLIARICGDLPKPAHVLVGPGDDCAVAESVKAASDIYAPVAGEVVAVNEELEDSPENVNSDPYGDGWLFKLKLEDASELDDLVDDGGYADSIDED